MDSLKSRLRRGASRMRSRYLPSGSTALFIDFPDIVIANSLAALPTELILSIADFLPLADLICLSMCSHRLRQILLRPISRLPRTDNHKFLVLNRLERHIPRYFACDICHSLHLFDGSESFGLSGLYGKQSCPLPCARSPRFSLPPISLRPHVGPDHSFNRLSFLQVKLAMRRFYHGPSSGISTDSLRWTQVREYCYSDYSDPISYPDVSTMVLSLFSMEAAICPEPLGLYVRLQDIAVVNRWDYLLSHNCSDQNPVYGLWACRHLHLLPFIHPWVESFLREESPERVLYAEGQCEICNVDYHIKVFEFGSKPIVVMTRWLSLGPGLAVDDPSCNFHIVLRWKVDRRQLRRKKNLLPRVSFESAATESFGSLNERNLLYLRNQNYRKTMQFLSARWLFAQYPTYHWSIPYYSLGGWYVPYREPSKRKRVIKTLKRLIGRSSDQAHEGESEEIGQRLPGRVLNTPQNTPEEAETTRESMVMELNSEEQFPEEQQPYSADFEVSPRHSISLAKQRPRGFYSATSRPMEYR